MTEPQHTEKRPPRVPPRRRRWPWIALAVVLLGAVVLAFAVPALLDVERHRGRIEAALRQATGWEPELGGIELSVLSGLRLVVSPAELRAPGDGSSLRIERLEVAAGLRPLLRGELQIRSLAILGPEVTLVRVSEADGWELPTGPASDGASTDGSPGPDGTARTPAPEAPTGGASRVVIQSIEVRDGIVRIEDRTLQPTFVLALQDVDLTLSPASAGLQGSANVEGGRGGLVIAGDVERGFELTLADLDADLFAPFLGEGVVQPGARMDGTIGLRLPFAVEGDLTARKLALLEGDGVLERAAITFAVGDDDRGLLLERLKIVNGEVVADGSGRLTPRLSLDLQVPEAPLVPLLEVARALFVLPLDPQAPGSGSVRATLRARADGEIELRANGEIRAASLLVSETLPPARDLRATFELIPPGKLRLELLDGTLAGGPLRGTVSLDSLDPPGRLVFDGSVSGAVLGQLVGGMVEGAAERVTGPTGFEAVVSVDLGSEELDATALGGKLSFRSSDVSLPGWDLERAIRSRLREKLRSIADIAALADPELARKLTEDDAADTAAVPATRRVLDDIVAEVDLAELPWKLPKFEMVNSGLTARGSGEFDPVNGTVRFGFETVLDAETTTSLVERYPQIRSLVGSDGRLALPLELSGPMLQPSIQPNLDRFRPDDALKEKARSKLKDAVKGLFK